MIVKHIVKRGGGVALCGALAMTDGGGPKKK